MNNVNIQNATNSSYSTDTPGKYIVIVTDSNKCRISSDTTDIILTPPAIKKIANVMTPGRNNCNSYFRIEGLGLGKVEVSIFNRWGAKVFDKNYDFSSYTDDGLCQGGNSNNQSQDMYYNIWDGTDKNNNNVDAGTYFYIINPYGIDGNPVSPKDGKLNGSITVLK